MLPSRRGIPGKHIREYKGPSLDAYYSFTSAIQVDRSSRYFVETRDTPSRLLQTYKPSESASFRKNRQLFKLSEIFDSVTFFMFLKSQQIHRPVHVFNKKGKNAGSNIYSIIRLEIFVLIVKIRL
jgi:hypothetical protein